MCADAPLKRMWMEEAAMSKFHWNEITSEDVISAIEAFDAEHPAYPEPRSTFLVFNGKKYPAKHIRGMAYQLHFGTAISKADYTGGQETVRFFEKLGFEVCYTHRNAQTHPAVKPLKGHLPKAGAEQGGEPAGAAGKIHVAEKSAGLQKISIPTKGVIEQKNALQLLLNKLFDGDVVCEKTFPWMKTPEEMSGEYISLCHALSAYRGDRNFAKKNVALRCDFVCESSKLIIEYDERQHFSEARRVSLLAYQNTPVHYDRDLWISACQAIQARDNQPVNRDEIRAFYDSTRDIEAARHGFALIRIMHGQIDFCAADAPEKLKALVQAALCDRSAASHAPDWGAPEKRSMPAKAVQIGLYLQTNELAGDLRTFQKAMNMVKASDIDILVFPEFSYVPFEEEMHATDFLSTDDVQRLYDKTLALSRSIGCAVVICNEDRYGTIMCIYANDFAADGDTICKDYIKHTMATFSACDIGNYRENAEDLFQPVLYHGLRIGLTICYDCNHAIFSRKYGLNGVDMILNCTGGNVVYDKWYKYNKVRAIENRCFTFVTMGGDGNMANPHNYVYGFTPSGKEMIPRLLNGVYAGKKNISGGIYVYDTADDDGKAEIDPSIHQAETRNKTSDFVIPAKDMGAFLQRGEALTEHIRVLPHGEENVILCFVDGENILRPEKVLKLLYEEKLKEIEHKRYIIINRWDTIDRDFYETTLSIVLKVRAMENYCAVVLLSDPLKKCYQCGQNRTAQVVKEEDGRFGIDLRRTGGPETIWRNKDGMKARWRDNIEWLIGTM